MTDDRWPTGPDPRHRDLVRRDGRGHRRGGHLGAVVGGQQPGRPARPLRRRRARDRQPGPRRPHRARRGPGLRRGRPLGPSRATARAARSTPSPPPTARAWSARCSWACRRPRRSPWRGTCRSSPSTTSRPTSTPRLLEEPDLELPLVVLLVSGGHTLARAHGGPRALPGARLHDRRRRRRGVRQGRPLPRARLPGRPGHRPARGRGRPRGDPVPAADGRRRHLRLLLQRAQDGGRQPRAQAPRRRPRPTWRRRSRRRSSTCSSPRPGPRPGRSAPRACASAAAWRPTPGSGSGSSTPASRTASAASCPSRAMCTDNAAMVASAAWYRWQSDGPSPLDTGAHPNLGLSAG